MRDLGAYPCLGCTQRRVVGEEPVWEVEPEAAAEEWWDV